MDIYRSADGSRVAVIGASWELNPYKISFEGLAPEFQRNEVLAWMNYGSVLLKVQGVLKAIRDATLLDRMVNPARTHPWNDERIEPLPSWFRGAIGRKYFVHIDLSKNHDGTGVAVVHREPGTSRWTVDLMLQLFAPPGAAIDIAGVRRTFVYDLHRKRGFAIYGVSYDGWQSEESLQTLEKDGYNASYLSVDRSMKPYDTVLELLNTGQLDYYAYAPFVQQMRELEIVHGKKYDHPKKFKDGLPGRKDVSDAVAGAIANGFEYERENPDVDAGQLFIHRNKDLTRSDRYRERSPW